MKLLIDTNVVLDILLKREPFYKDAAAVSEREIKNALTLEWKDFEDSVQYSVALLSEMDAVVTRNPDDYRQASVRVFMPEQILAEHNS